MAPSLHSGLQLCNLTCSCDLIVPDNQASIWSEPPVSVWWSFHSLACPPSYFFINNHNLSPPPDFILKDKLAHPSQINHTPPYIRTYNVPWAAKVKGVVVQRPHVLLCMLLNTTSYFVVLHLKCPAWQQCEGEEVNDYGHFNAILFCWQMFQHNSVVRFTF